MPSASNDENESPSLADKLFARLQEEAERIKAVVGDPSVQTTQIVALLVSGCDPEEIIAELSASEEEIRKRQDYHEAFRMVLSQPDHIQGAYFKEFARRCNAGTSTDDPAAESREILAMVLTKEAAKKAKKRRGDK